MKMYSLQMFKVINGLQKAIRGFYILLIVATIYSSAYGFISDTSVWSEPALKVLSIVEIVLVMTYLGLLLSITLFGRFEGVFMGTDVANVIAYWKWLMDKVKDVLIYNGILGFIIFSLYIK